MKPSKPIGFIGIGTMGMPMAENLLKAHVDLIVWNRTADKCQPLKQMGASVAKSVADVFERSETVVLMLANEKVTDNVLHRGTDNFKKLVSEHTLISMGTVSAEYSHCLSEDIRKAGGCLIEAPVSGSRVPAETGQLVGMVAGPADNIKDIRHLLQPICKQVFECGLVPNALQMKLAVNTFLITLVTGLVEATHFASEHKLDLGLFEAILNAGPMASDISKSKLAKLKQSNFERQAGISDVRMNAGLIADAARKAQIVSPLLDISLTLYQEAENLGFGEQDMASVLHAFQARTNTLTEAPLAQ